MARRKIWLLLSVALFAACLPFDTFCVSGECSGWPGYGVLLFGFPGMPLSSANMIWLAVPILFCSWVAILVVGRALYLCQSLSALALSAVVPVYENNCRQ